MGFLEPFVAVLVILQESLKLLPKNGRLMAFTMIVPTLLSSLSFVIFLTTYKKMSRSILAEEGSFEPITRSDSQDFATIPTGFYEDFTQMLAVCFVFILAVSIISLYSTIATIILSASSYRGRTLSIKDLASLTVQAYKRQYTTRFYTSLLVLGYIVFVSFVASPVLIFSGNSLADELPTAILVGIAACIWYMYLSVAWILGIIVSIIEENCTGIEALGKAARLLEGKRMHGFILNIMFTLLTVVIFGGVRIIRGQKWKVDDLIFWLLIATLSSLLRFFNCLSYTVLYFQCKKNHGEEIGLEGGFEYTKVSTKQPVDDMP